MNKKILGTDSILVYDLETATVGSRPNGEKDEFRIFGCYSYKTKKYHFLTKPTLIKQIINDHKFLVGFNNKNYDNAVLYQNPFFHDIMYKSKYGSYGFQDKIVIDLMEIFKKRASAMKIKKGMLGDLLMKFSLSYIAKTIELGSYKDDDFDYGLLAEPVPQWSPEKLKTIVDYTKQDLLVTKEMYEWLEEYFGSFKDFVTQENIDNKSYLTCSTAVFAYKCLCKELGVPEEYGESGLNVDFGGGFVALPTVSEEHGNILLFDFSSLYPNLFIMGNLFGDKCSCCDDIEKWNGNNFFRVEGNYCNKQLAALGKVLKKFYLMRKEMKKVGDPREYSIKIIINSCFSGDTDILTTTGIKNIKDCNVGDLVYSLNKDTEQVEIKPITDTQVFGYNGDMIHFKKRNVDLMVTPDHKMLLKKSKKSKIKEIEAQNFIKEKTNVLVPTNPIKGINNQYFDLSDFNINKNWFIKLDNPYSQRKNKNLNYKPMKRLHQSLNGYNENLKGKWYFQTRNRDMYIQKDVNITDLFYLIGIFLSEGHAHIIHPKNYKNGNKRGKTYSIFISQYETVNKKTYYKIKSILDNLQIRYSLSKKGFYISSHFWYHFLKQFTNGNEKIIPNWIFKYDSSILYYLHDGLYDGDGDKRDYRYTTKYEFLANQIVQLNLHLGHRCTMGYDSNCYRIWRTGGGLYIRNNQPMHSYIPNPDNKVYCVTVADNHTVYAGRNKKLSWVGQCYGAVSNSSFKNIYNPVAGADCTRLGRQFIRYARKRFRAEGYELLMTDTDSIAIKLPENKTKEQAQELANKVVKELLSNVPFPWDDFEFKIDAEITDMFFVKDDRKHIKEEFIVDGVLDADDERMINNNEFYLKKNYLYITKDNKVTFKNLNIKKKSVSALSRKLFRDILIPEIIKQKTIQFDKSFIDDKINELLENDITLAGVRYVVREPEEYKVEHQIQCQIARRYGAGIHVLTPNKRFGVGKAKRYCLVEEFKEKGFSINDLDLRSVYKELKYFIKEDPNDLKPKRKSKRNRDIYSANKLGEWF